MPACPCCLEELRPAFLGLGGRRLVAACEVCGDRVCEACLRAPILRAGDFRMRQVPSWEARRRVKGIACASCLWALLSARGERPPFPEPPGHRQRAAQAGCAHPRLVRWMRCCPDCGAAVGWQAESDAPLCDACGAPSHALFNACWACGESFEEENDPQTFGEPALDRPCCAGDCAGRVAWPMRFCPWCAAAQRWPHTVGAAAFGCLECDTPLDPTWVHCIACGAEAPPPERCVECAQPLEQAACAARCEQCRHLVCGACFGDYALDAQTSGGPSEELRLCTTCAEELGASPVAAEPDDAEPDEVEPDDAEPDDAEPDDAEPDDAEPDDAGEAPRAQEPEPAAAAAEEDDRAEDVEAPPPPASASAWDVLGVAPGTPLPDVRRAYLTLVAQYHPDKVAQLGPKLQALALEETRRLNDAWSELRERAG